MTYSVVIPSKNIANLAACVGRLREMGETAARVIVVGDELACTVAEYFAVFRKLGACDFVEGEVPFIFARNVNIGIRAAGVDDIVCMNDDALLETPNGLARLSQDAAEHPEYGVIAASVDSCGTLNQIHCSVKSGIRDEKVMLAFICVYIPRRTIDQIGLLDERFGVNAGGPGKRGYGLEDDDYCWRVREAGMKLSVDNDVVVNHTTLPSTFRHDKAHPADVFAHEALFEKKWGKHPRRPF